MKTLFFILVMGLGFIATGQNYPMGANWDAGSYRSIPYKATYTRATYENLPASYSLEKWSPIPGNQGQFGTCVAFAAAYGVRTMMYAKDNNITDKSQITQAALSPSYVYSLIKNKEDLDCSQGADGRMGLEALKQLGAPTLKTLPYSCNPELTKDAQNEAYNYLIRDYNTLFYFEDTPKDLKVNTVKKALTEGYPVLLVMKLPNSFMKREQTVWRSLASEKGTVAAKHGHHAMTIVGYDDNFEGGAFRLLNSWDTNWGDGGFIWVPYSEFDIWARGAMQPYSFYEKKDEPKPGPNVEPDDNPIAGELPKGSLKFETNTGQPMEVSRISTRNLVVEDDIEGEDLVAYRMTKGYPSGTRFRFYLQNENEGYIYAFATDLTQKINKILPYEDGMSPLIGANSELAFPSEKKVIRMDNNPGTDYLLILFSQQKLDENALQAAMQNASGGLTSKIKKALGDKLIDKSDVKYQSGNPGFEVKEGAAGYVVPLMVEITHN